MDKKIVGANAGKVWHALNEADGISIPELARKVNLSVESTALAVGWLARENKVVIERKNGLKFIMKVILTFLSDKYNEYNAG